jgi:tetratricopeptide (TPR) repeat protein
MISRAQGPCPPEMAWDELAAGLTHGAPADVLLEHASWCEECAAKLRASIEIFAPQEESEQPSNVVALRQPALRLGGIRRYWPAAALVAALAGGAVWMWLRPPDPLTELAALYSANRSLELRVPDAPYGPMRVPRGSAGGGLSKQPATMLETAARIQRGLEASPGDAHILHARGRLALLEWHPQEAIDALEAARDTGAAGAGPLIDLATAYYEMAKRQDSSAGLHKAVELLGQVLRSDPNNTVARYNRALVEEELHETAAAVADLEKCLQLERAGGWSEEVRTALEHLRARRGAFLQRDPAEDRNRFVEARLDAILQNAAVNGMAGGDAAELARSLKEEHHDLWLAELTALPPGTVDPEEIRSLGRMTAIRLTLEKGLYKQEKAAFDAPHGRLPLAVAVWHAFEALYRATHARGEFHCPETSEPLQALAEQRGYRWLAVQVLREQGYCSFQKGDIDAADHYAQRSIQLARQAGYPIAAVRSAGLRGHTAIRRGQFRRALDIAQSALKQIQTERLPVARSQEFYNIAMVALEGLEWWHGARAAAASVTESARVAGFRDLEFTGAVREAQLALRSGAQVEAGELFERALAKYDRLAPSLDREWAEIGFADATGDESRLDQFEGTLDRAPDAMLWIPYERVRARLALNHGRIAEAENRLNRIVTWMASYGTETSAPGYRWEAEFRAAGQLMQEVLDRQGRLAESYGFLQRWLALEERAHSPVAGASRVRIGTAVAFAVAAVGPRIAVWRRDGDHVAFRWSSVERPEAERLARSFTRLMESPSSSPQEIHKVGSQIRAGLFGHWLDNLPPGRRLVIQVYTGPFANLAFAALPGHRDELGLENPVAVTPFELRSEDAPEDAGSTGPLLLVDASDARPEWAADLPPLRAAGREVAAIHAAWPDSEILSQEAAWPERLAGRLQFSRLLHFAGHALLTGSEIALVLPGSKAPGDLLELRGGQVRTPRTVVLSACSTGRRTGAIPDTGSPGSLAAAFLLKGSGEVIASLWDVDSAATEELMQSFYLQLRATRDTGIALQAAMAAMRRSSRYSHPHYWAAFARFVRT